jgi:sugar lactone lactonase YvrE
MNSNQSVTATFSQNATRYTLTVIDSGQGTVTSADTLIDCVNNTGNCVQSYPSGSIVTVNASAAAGWSFTGWGGFCTGPGSCLVAMTANRTVTANFIQGYTISGQVTYNGSGLAGVAITLSVGASGSTTTDSSGNYSFSGLAAGGNYAVVPSFSGYTFSPAGEEFTGLNANQTANFTANANNGTYGISGQVTIGEVGLAEVTMLLSGGQTTSTTTNASGFYSFSGLAAGINYLVTPSLSGYIFTPPTLGFTPLNSNQTANFLAGTSPSPVLAFTPGIISTTAGNGTAGYGGDGGPAASAELNTPWGTAVDPGGNFYIADTGNSRVRVVNTQTGSITVAGVTVQPGAIATVAGNGVAGYSGDGIPATQAELNQPISLVIDGAGNLYIADSVNARIREVSTSGVIATVAGNGQAGSSGDGGPATNAEFYSPRGVALDSSGNLYIADFSANRVRAVNRQSSAITIAGITIQPGTIATVAGNGTAGYSGDGGLAVQAEINGPSNLAIDSASNLYIADYYNNFIRKVSLATGTITTAAGSGTPPYNNYFWGDGGPATKAQLWLPGGVTVDAAGDFYVVDTNNNRIRIVSAATGIINTLAGSGPVPNDYGYAGDGGPATSALLNFPMGTAIDSKGNFYIADRFNNRIREVNVQQTTLNFTQINVGQVSAAQDVTVTNVENQTLSISQISSSAGFNENGADTTCSSGTTLAPGASCILGIEFAPVHVGPVTGSVVIIDNATNSPQSILVSGAGAQGTPTLTWNPATTSIAYGTGLSAGVLDATATANGNPVVGNYAYTATPSGGSPQAVTVGTILPVGAYTLSVLFTPTDTTDYTTATASIPFTVSPASLAVQLTGSATSIIVGQTVTFTATLSGMTGGVGPTGSVVFYDGTTQIGTGPVTLISGQYQAAYSTNSLAVGQHNITAQYPGDANYNTATSNTVTVTVNPSTPPLTVSPTVLSFGNHALGSSSAAKKVTVTNKTGVVVTFYSWTIIGANASDFTQSATTCGTTLKVKASCTISIVFAPGAVGARSAALTITDSASNSPQSVSLTGTGILPVTLTPAAEKFPATKVGVASAAKMVTIKNNLPTVLTLSGTSFTGANAGDFAQSGTTCGGTLGAGLTCTVSIKFTPTAKGSRVAILNVSDSAITSPQTVALSGTGK